MSISENVMNALKNTGVSATELADLSGVPASRISEIVTGKTKNPQMKTLIKLARALAIDVTELTGVETRPIRTLDEVIDGADVAPEYKIAMRELLKKTPEEIFEWLAEERRKERVLREGE